MSVFADANAERSQVSVIIPTWNRGATIRTAITSALAQTRPPLEILICDDGSTDDSKLLVNSIEDPRVRWIEGPRGGSPAIPRNRGIGQAKGEWLAFLDSDDVWLPNKLELQLDVLQRTGGRTCCTDAWRQQPDAAAMPRLIGGDDTVFDLEQLLKGNRVICSSVVMHRSLIAEAEGFPETIPAEDYALWLRISCEAKWHYVGAPLLIYHDAPQASARADFPGPAVLEKIVFSDFDAWCARHPSAATNAAHETLAHRRPVRAKASRKLMKPIERLRRQILGE